LRRLDALEHVSFQSSSLKEGQAAEAVIIAAEKNMLNGWRHLQAMKTLLGGRVVAGVQKALSWLSVS
jgi:hypothetical protein